MDEQRKISDVDLIRVLGEYTDKVQRARERYQRETIWLGGTFLAVFAGATVMTLAGVLQSTGLAVVAIIAAIIIGAVVAFASTLAPFERREHVELAVWQLRRVYELASRREDLGVELDSGTRLELELRLSEAAFLLTDLEKFHKPEKFRQFTRIGKDSPFREIEPDLQWPPPAQSIPSPKSSS